MSAVAMHTVDLQRICCGQRGQRGCGSIYELSGLAAVLRAAVSTVEVFDEQLCNEKCDHDLHPSLQMTGSGLES
jgi:hypothetical protein